MKHYIYKITNLLNNREYIGVRSHPFPEEDSYMSSSLILKEEIRRVGIENFKKEILEYFNSREEADLKEVELVDYLYVINPNTYNQRTGGPSGVALSSLRLDVYKDVDTIVERYKKGESAEEIARDYKVDGSLITKRIIPSNIKRSISESNKLSKIKHPPVNKRKDIDNKSEEIIERYKAGEGVHILASAYQCHVQVIGRILKDNNVKRRSASESQKCRVDLKKPRRKDLWDSISEIKSLYLENKTFTEIGRIFNTSDVQIRLMLKKENII